MGGRPEEKGPKKGGGLGEDRENRTSMHLPFGAYLDQGHRWITIFDSPYYPDTLDAARTRYGPVIEAFAELASHAPDTPALFREIQSRPPGIRIQLLRVFRRYVSPDTTVEMLKRIRSTEQTIERFGTRFRSIEIVLRALEARPNPDEALIALLDEHHERGQKGYQLTEAFFVWFETAFDDRNWSIEGPSGAGRDIELQNVLPDYKISTPADFVISDRFGTSRVIGFARYDSDRGGAQEDDRIGGNARRLQEILAYNEAISGPLKVVFLNDGPGLLLGSMWRDYASVETSGKGRALVTTLKMAQAGRLTADWIDRMVR
jgi:hypothetical protein